MKADHKSEYFPLAIDRIKDRNVILQYHDKKGVKHEYKIPLRLFKKDVRMKQDRYKLLEIYLRSIFVHSFHKTPELFGRLNVHELEYTYAKDVCRNLGLVKNNKITDKGIAFLRYTQQEKINNSMRLATWILAIGTSLLAIFTLTNIILSAS